MSRHHLRHDKTCLATLRGMYRQAVWMSLLKGVAIGLLYLVTIVATVWVLIMLAFLRA